MKCIILKTKKFEIRRVSDEEARNMVNKGLAEFTSKSNWRKFRDR